MNTQKLIYLSVILLAAITCKREYSGPLDKSVDAVVESQLTEFTGGASGFTNATYGLNIKLASSYYEGWNYPVTATINSNLQAQISNTTGTKNYAATDTIALSLGVQRTLSFKPKDKGIYRVSITYNSGNEVVGSSELNFTIDDSDLSVQFIRDGRGVDNLNTPPNIVESGGQFVIRVSSTNEILNNSKLSVKMNISGTAAKITNWTDGQVKISSLTDASGVVDFWVTYNNEEIGNTALTITAQTAENTVVVQSNITVAEAKAGDLWLEADEKEGEDYLYRKELWVGQVDSMSYIIKPEANMPTNYQLKFEYSSPTKLWFFNTGDLEKQNASTMYDANIWHDFSDKLSGKLYYIFPGGAAHSEIVTVSLRNGTQGDVKKYKVFLSSKQADDFDFYVVFKPTLSPDGFDEIKLSELTGFNDLITLNVIDANPYAKFDYTIGFQNINEIKRQIVHRSIKLGWENQSTVSWATWLANEYGYIINTKSFNLVCLIAPTDNTTANGYLENDGRFNWVYLIRRTSDGKEKTVTRQIKIVDDRLDFKIELVQGNNRENVYQNETLVMYQLKYLSPSLNADDYELTVTTSNAARSDVYVINKASGFDKINYNIASSAPATHNTGETAMAAADAGRIQIKGKEVGVATINFTLRHKISGATKTITKTVTTLSDPVQYIIEPAPTIDLLNTGRDAISLTGEFHTYQNPRFKIRLSKASNYSGNTENSASVVFTNTSNTVNSPRMAISTGTSLGTYHTFGSTINMDYNTDYYVTVVSSGNHPWSNHIPAGSEISLTLKMTKATNQETKIEEMYNNLIKYKLRAYQPSSYNVTGQVSQNACGMIEYDILGKLSLDLSEANVTIHSSTREIKYNYCIGSFSVNSFSLSSTITTTKDGQNIYSTTLKTSTGTYNRSYYEGNSITAYINTPTIPGWNNYPAVTITDYYGAEAQVQDNWGHVSNVPIKILNNVVYGYNGAMQ